MQNLKRGFTLIELLVVIAIIGILAAIVLASLGTARSKGNDAKVKEQLNSIRNAAEVYYSTNNSYGAAYASGALTTGACNGAGSMYLDTASGMVSLVSLSNYPGGTTLICNTATNGTGYAVAGSLSGSCDGASTDTYWCVDSTGASKCRAALGANTSC